MVNTFEFGFLYSFALLFGFCDGNIHLSFHSLAYPPGPKNMSMLKNPIVQRADSC